MHSTRPGWPVVLIALGLGCGLAAGGERDAGAGGSLFPLAEPDARKDGPYAHPLFPDTASPTPHTARNERALFALACSYFDDRAYQLTADTLGDFLRRYPRSRQAAEARYRIGLALQLQGKPDEAGRAFEELLDKHPQSPFARLVLEVHLGEEQLRALATDELRRARDPDRHGRARKALDLLELYARRFPDGPLKRESLVYRLGTCHRLLDQMPEFRSAMQSILDNAPRTAWAKLASCWLDRGEYFQKHMGEILEQHADGEELLTFLDLAEQLGPLKEAERVRCLFLQGRCLHLLDRDLEAEKTWSRLIRKHPRSPLAAEALFWLAEHYYERKDVVRAEEAYESLLKHYPTSAHAEDVKRWLAWLEDHDGTWEEAERLLAEWAGQLADFKGGVAFSVRMQAGKSADDVRCQVAVQDRDHYRIELALGPQRFLLASNRSGGWYRSWAEPYAVHTREGIPLTPLPYLQWKIDPATGAGSLTLSTAGPSRAEADLTPYLKLPPSWAAQTVTWLQSGYHLHREVRKAAGEERILYRLEAAQTADARLTCWEVETDARHRLLRAKYITWNDRHERVVWQLSDVRLQGQLPADALRVDLPKGLPVQERARVNTLDLVGELCKLCGRFLDSWPDGEEAAEVPAKK
jgi:TolA-binding protein